MDKLPANWMNVGLIRLILPNARIIDARRHPMACAFSNFKQHYATGVTFAYNLSSIGQFYVDYLRLMDHFDAVQPLQVHHVLNERRLNILNAKSVVCSTISDLNSSLPAWTSIGPSGQSGRQAQSRFGVQSTVRDSIIGDIMSLGYSRYWTSWGLPSPIGTRFEPCPQGGRNHTMGRNGRKRPFG